MTQASTIPGGRSRAEQAADGMWRIFNAPIFAELQADVKGALEASGGDDPRVCIQLAMKRGEGETLPTPLSTCHLEPDTHQPGRVGPAGFLPWSRGVRSHRRQAVRYCGPRQVTNQGTDGRWSLAAGSLLKVAAPVLPEDRDASLHDSGGRAGHGDGD